MPALPARRPVGERPFQALAETVNPYYLRGDWVCYEKERLRLLRNEQGEKRTARSASAEQEVQANVDRLFLATWKLLGIGHGGPDVLLYRPTLQFNDVLRYRGSQCPLLGFHFFFSFERSYLRAPKKPHLERDLVVSS